MTDDSVKRAQAATDALAALISAADPNLDGKSLANALIYETRSPAQVFESDAADLALKPGMNRVAADAVALIDGLCRFVEREKQGAHPIINHFDKASAYLKTLYIGVHLEKCYLLCLDPKARMISCKLIQEGTIDRSAIYMRALAETALKTSAKYVVLAHNHPGGSESPSGSDIDATIDALDAMQAINVVLLDHIIIADRAPISIRAQGLPAERAWLNQRRYDPLIANWFA